MLFILISQILKKTSQRLENLVRKSRDAPVSVIYF